MWQENNESVRKLFIRAEGVIPQRLRRGLLIQNQKISFWTAQADFRLINLF